MRRDAQAVLLLLVGGTLLKISLTGSYVRYVKPGLLPLLLIAGVALLAIAAVTLWQSLRSRTGQSGPVATEAVEAGAVSAVGGSAGHLIEASTVAPQGSEADHSDHPAGHHHDDGRVGWLLLVPALALLLLAPPALGSFQASRSGTALSAASKSDFAPLPEGDPVRVQMLDYAARAVFDQGRSLASRRVTMSGFIIAGPDGQPYLARLVVGCCAADARPVKVGLTGDVPADLVPDQWVEVEGLYSDRTSRDPVNRELIPYLQVTSVRQIEAPEQPYES
ncbi:MAG TPA: TIGR03943 family protein [Micromonosporaceae bacterium]